MKFYRCDKCEKEIVKPFRRIFYESLLRSEANEIIDGLPYKTLDLCRECYDELNTFLKARKEQSK